MKRGKQHNYEKKLQQLMAQGLVRAGSVNDVYIEHDDWCRINKGGACNCDPDIRIVEYVDDLNPQ